MPTVAELPVLSVWEAPRCGGASPREQSWSGFLTALNYRHVAARLLELLDGHAFVVASAYEYKGWEPEVRAPRWLADTRDDGLLVAATDYAEGEERDRPHVGVSFSDDGILYMLSSTLERQPPLRFLWWGDDRVPHGPARDVLRWMDEAYGHWWTPHLEFTERSLVIKDRAPNGLAYWLRLDRLEGAGGIDVVLHGEQAAAARAGLLDLRPVSAAANAAVEHIDRVFPGNERWL